MVQLAREYGPETWDVYEWLDRSLDPSGPDSLFDIAASYLAPGARIADVGCRDAAHLVKLISAHPGTTGVGVDPVDRHIARARETVAAAGLGNRIELVHGTVEEGRLPNGSVDLVWCRDTIVQVPALEDFVIALAGLLKPTGRMIVYSNFVTDRLERGEEDMMRRHFGVVFANLNEHLVLDAYRVAGLEVERTVVVGSEWREWAEERTQPVSRSLLQLSRLRRQRDEIIAERGQDVYEHVEAQLHWLLFQFLGKFNPVIHVLRAAGGVTNRMA
ncbi:MAG TPA: class I SAM-dependent methyltransferase [Micromonosporaceae bacterium]|nr:class I SAM-dependent methyltransferase [Micromonosporaceae bacterium]